jgi:hypothetical protein
VAGGLTAQQGSIRGPLSVDGAATVGGALSVGGVITAWPGAVLGQLGIGTREPKQQLHVEGDALVHRLFLGDVGHGDSWAGLGHANAASTTGYGFLQSNDGRSTLLNKRSGGGVLQFRVDNAAKVTLVDSGHLGIGTDAPAARLHVAGGAILAELGSSADAGIRFPRAKLPWPNSAYVRYFEEGGGATMLIGTDSARNRLVLEQGNRRLTLEDEVVTISSSYTSTLLDVKGQIHAQGQIHSGGQHSYPGLSFADRSTPDADVFGEVAGRRWAWYAEQGQARLWTWDAYPLIVDKFGNLTVAGDITCKSLTPGSKKLGYVADAFVNPGEHPLEEGEVVVLADAKPALFVGFEGKIPVPEVERTAKAYDTRVCGIVAEAHGEQVATSRRKNAPQELRTFTDEERDDLDTTQVGPGQAGAMVTLGAYASCKVDASYGAIEVGDLLTTSETPGHAMKASDPARATGAIIGKALAPRARGQGTIPVMVFLQ